MCVCVCEQNCVILCIDMNCALASEAKRGLKKNKNPNDRVKCKDGSGSLSGGTLKCFPFCLPEKDLDSNWNQRQV